MKKPNKLWEIGWSAYMEGHPDHLWVLANSAELAARKAKKYLHKQGNTSIQIKVVQQHGEIDVF